jgi:hypothetical protein
VGCICQPQPSTCCSTCSIGDVVGAGVDGGVDIIRCMHGTTDVGWDGTGCVVL